MNLTALALMGVALGAGQPIHRGQAPQGGDYQVAKTRSLQIGIDYKPDRKRDIRSVLLYMSRDLGSTWELVAQELPTKTAFTFNAPNDGVYFLNMAIQYQDGKTDPPDVSRVPPAQKLIIDTTKHLVVPNSAQRNGDEVSVEWTIDEKNPNEASTRVFYRPVLGDNGSWQTVPMENMARRSARFTPTISGAILVQVVNADLAGNIGAGTREVTTYSPNPTTTNTNSSFGPPRRFDWLRWACCAAKVTWARTCVDSDRDWVHPRRSRRWPTSWHGSFTRSCGTAWST